MGEGGGRWGGGRRLSAEVVLCVCVSVCVCVGGDGVGCAHACERIVLLCVCVLYFLCAGAEGYQMEDEHWEVRGEGSA